MHTQLSLVKTMALACGAALLMMGVVLALLGAPGAVQAAPTDMIQSMIDLAPAGGTINIPSGTYTESLTVNKTLTLTGVSSATTIIQAISGQRVITVTSGHNLHLENLTLTGGHPASDVGGGVYAIDGNLLIINCRIANNSAAYGGGVFQSGGGRVDVSDSWIELNTTGNHGGGLYVNGNAALTDTLVLSNTADGHGGGLHVDVGSTTLSGGLFSNNRALGDNGGAVNVNHDIRIQGTHFISNTANDSGGALLQWNAGYTVTVTNARFERNTAKNKGGGAFIAGVSLISNSTFVTNTVDSGNTNTTSGGGLYAGGTGQIVSTLFMGNVVRCNDCLYPSGGGLYSAGSSTVLSTVTFSGNQARGASGSGGGMCGESGDLTVNNTIFSGNQADSWGGGLYSHNDAVTLGNVVFSGNKAFYGGGVFDVSRNLALTHCTFSGNSASSGALYSMGNSAALVNCIVWGNQGEPQLQSNGTLSVTYSDIQFASIYTGTGNINADPRFVTPLTGTVAPTTAGNYRLLPTSPAIDTGVSAGVTTDLDGVTRPQGSGYDMGAYEFHRFSIFLPMVVKQ